MGLSRPSVIKWRKRFIEQGLMGLYEESRPGAPRSIDDEQIARLLRQTLETRPKGPRTGVPIAGPGNGAVEIHRKALCGRPRASAPPAEALKLSTDPFIVEKVRDIVGLYLNPPDKAMVLCVDEKSGSSPGANATVIALGLGYVEGVTHDYLRHGTTTLFAALDVASGQVRTFCKPRHRHQEFLQFLNHIDQASEDLDLHLIVDNYTTHKHPKVKQWLASRPRYHIHYTPTYASWLNQVEIWFNLITQQAIRRGRFPRRQGPRG